MAKIDFKKIDTYRKTFDGILQVKKHVGSEDDLPVSGAQNGDIYTVGDSDTLYMFNNGEWGTLGSGGSTDWNDITNKPFYTKTFPSINLPNGVKIVIDGYVKDGAQVDERYGRYSVTDTRFDVTLINSADNTVLEKVTGVIPEIDSQTASRRNMRMRTDFELVHLNYAADEDGIMGIELGWSELAAFNEKVRTWSGYVLNITDHSTSRIYSISVVTPAKPSAVKGEDYDTAVYDDSIFAGGDYKKPDEVKKIDSKYLPDQNAHILIKGTPTSETSQSDFEAMGVTVENIKAVAGGSVNNVFIQEKAPLPTQYTVTFRYSTGEEAVFRCEHTDFLDSSIQFTRYTFFYSDGTIGCDVQSYTYQVSSTSD